MSEPALLRELTPEGVLLLTLNRPDRMNALNGEISEASWPPPSNRRPTTPSA